MFKGTKIIFVLTIFITCVIVSGCMDVHQISSGAIEPMTVEATASPQPSTTMRQSEVLPDDCQAYVAGMVYFHPPNLITGFAECGSLKSIDYYRIVSEDGQGAIWVNKSSGHISNESYSWVFDDKPSVEIVTPTPTPPKTYVTCSEYQKVTDKWKTPSGFYVMVNGTKYPITEEQYGSLSESNTIVKIGASCTSRCWADACSLCYTKYDTVIDIKYARPVSESESGYRDACEVVS